MTQFSCSLRAFASALLVLQISCTSWPPVPWLAYDLPMKDGSTQSWKEMGTRSIWTESTYQFEKFELHIMNNHLASNLHDDSERERVLQESLQEPRAMLATLSTNPKESYRRRILKNSMPGVEVGFVDASATRVVRVLVGEAYVVVVWADAREAGVTLEEIAAWLDLVNVRESSGGDRKRGPTNS